MVLGIDPGLASCGWAVVDGEKNLIASGCIETTNKISFSDRLLKIYHRLIEVCRQNEVNEMAVESLFFAKNIKTAMKVAQALGVIKLAGKTSQLEVFEYTPLQIKMALTGYGRAEKQQVMAMVKQTLAADVKIKNDHVGDAIAAALTHMFTLQKEKLA